MMSSFTEPFLPDIGLSIKSERTGKSKLNILKRRQNS
jgi:hypothetical protein